MKLTNKQVQEVQKHMRRHGSTYEEAREAVLSGYGTTKAERARMYEDRRMAMRAQDNASFSMATGFILGTLSRQGRHR